MAAGLPGGLVGVGFAEFEVDADAERSTVGVGAVGAGDLELLS
jgi:hypothetical protein